MKQQWRQLLKVAGTGAVLGVFGIALFLAYNPALALHRPTVTVVQHAAIAADPAPIHTSPEQISSLLQIDVSVKPTAPVAGATWERVSADDVVTQSFLLMLHEEWSKYPSGMHTQAGLQHIYLVKNLSVRGQAHSAMLDATNTKALYYDVSNSYQTVMNGQYMRRVIHHEYAHYLEYGIYHSYYQQDAAWSGCNTNGFAYGDGGQSAYSDPIFANTYHPSAGFISGYAESGIEEDRAEIFAWLMTKPVETKNLGILDSHLACKETLTAQFYTNYGLTL